MKLGAQIGLGHGHNVLDGDPAPPPQRAQPPIFGPYLLRPNGCIDQDATVEVGFGPGDFVLDGDPVPFPQKGSVASLHPIFGPCLLWSNGWMDQDGTWHGGRPETRGLCVRWGPSPHPKFSAHVYYSYCDFLRTLHRRKVLLVWSSLEFCAFYF